MSGFMIAFGVIFMIVVTGGSGLLGYILNQLPNPLQADTKMMVTLFNIELTDFQMIAICAGIGLVISLVVGLLFISNGMILGRLKKNEVVQKRIRKDMRRILKDSDTEEE